MGMKSDVAIIFILLIIVGIGLYFIIPMFFGETQEFKVTNFVNDKQFDELKNIEINGNYSLEANDWPEGMLFYPNIRFSNREIGYYIDDKCDESKYRDSKKAFNKIDELSVLTFFETDSNEAKIFVSCPKNKNEVNRNSIGGHFIAGEGGPSSVINTTNYYLILNGSILLYSENKCEEPIIAIHELLHVIGFKHSSNKKSIMYNVSNCEQKITSDIIDQINFLYNDVSLADITFISANASRTGNYINFRVEIINSGIKDSGNFQLKLLSNGKEIGKYDIENLSPGSGKILKVENLFSFSRSKELTFTLDQDNIIDEIDETNNKLIMEFE